MQVKQQCAKVSLSTGRIATIQCKMHSLQSIANGNVHHAKLAESKVVCQQSLRLELIESTTLEAIRLGFDLKYYANLFGRSFSCNQNYCVLSNNTASATHEYRMLYYRYIIKHSL